MAFPYPSLPDDDGLRLLLLKKGGFFDPLEGDLIPASFLARPKYLALSYTWGDPTPEQPGLPAAFTRYEAEGYSEGYEPAKGQKEATLVLNGHDVSIGHNLALALRYLRSSRHSLTLWVDAVCINQADIDERNAQVALMALIYSRAIAVVTWLGLNAPEVMGALQTFDQDGGLEASMAMRDVYNSGNSKELASWFADHVATDASANARNITESRAAEKESLERIVAINGLGDTMVMNSSYWQRVWVVQEVCLAQKVFFVYGPTMLVDEEALEYAHQMNMLRVVSGMKNMLEARKTRFTETMRLETLIEEFASQVCTEPRDKIFGLVGLANDVNAVKSSDAVQTEGYGDDDGASIRYNGDDDVEFIIDYRRSFYNIWCDTVQYLFQCPYYFVPPYLDTDEEELARLRHQRLTNVVRFAGLVQNTLQDEVERELAHLATSATPAEIEAQLRGPRLFDRHLVPARGYLAGKILDLGPSYADFVGSFRHQTAWRTKWRRHYRKEIDLYQLREMEERYAAKILNYSEADVARIARIEGGSFMAFRSIDDGPLDKLTAAHTSKDDIQAVDDLLKGLSIKSTPDIEPGGKVNRFLGTDRCMGLAPPGAVVGDWVIRFWDCDAAIIVRPGDTSDPASSCALVGRADVADIHDRKGPLGDRVADEALKHNSYSDEEHKRFDILMEWHTLQLITASIST